MTSDEQAASPRTMYLPEVKAREAADKRKAAMKPKRKKGPHKHIWWIVFRIIGDRIHFYAECLGGCDNVMERDDISRILNAWERKKKGKG